MFGRARLQLTAWYTGALALVIITLGVTALVVVRRSLDAEINDSLNQTRKELTTGGQLVARPGPPNGPGARPLTSDDDDYRSELAPSDVFFVTTTADGTVAANPRRVKLDGIDFAALVRAAGGRDNRADIHANDHHYRIASWPLASGPSGSGGYIHFARSLDARDHQLNTLAGVMIFGGVAGIVLSALAGYWLAGRTLVPIRRSLEAQRQFISDASHELRTPTAVIRANNELLLRHPEQTVGQNMDAVEAINDGAEQMTHLIEDLLTLARADEGRVAIELERFNLAELLSDVARDMGPIAAAAGIELNTDFKDVTVEADHQRIRQAAVILLDNALKYTPAGGIVTMRSRRASRQAELSVTDSGPGIAEADQRRVFERFARAGQARGRSDGGTGLGLAIASWIADVHHGTIAVESVPGNGATFRIRLPLAD
jgi:signal transduction histidine kinase